MQQQPQLLLPALFHFLAAGRPDGEAAEQLGRQDVAVHELLQLGKQAARLELQVQRLREGSLYQRSLSAGLQQLHQDYLAALCELEEECLKDTSLSPFFLRFRLQKFSRVLPAVCAAVGGLVKEGTKGGQLLTALHSLTLVGDEDVRQAAQRLLHCAVQPFLSQLSDWLAYGTVQDEHGEFFAKACMLPTVDYIESGSGVAVSAMPGAEASALFGTAASASHVAASTTASLASSSSSQDDSQRQWLSSLLEEQNWSTAWSFVPANVPSFLLSQQLAETCVAAGRAVQLLLSAPPSGQASATSAAAAAVEKALAGVKARAQQMQRGEKKERSMCKRKQQLRGKQLLEDGSSAAAGEAAATTAVSRHLDFQGNMGEQGGEEEELLERSSSSSKSSASSLSSSRSSLSDSDDGESEEEQEGPSAPHLPARFTREDSFAVARLLSSLHSTPVLEPLSLEVVLNRIHSMIYGRLGRLLLEDCAFMLHMRSLRSFLLGGRGDFLQALLERMEPFSGTVASTAGPSLGRLLRGPWRSAAELCGLEARAAAFSELASFGGGAAGAGAGAGVNLAPHFLLQGLAGGGMGAGNSSSSALAWLGQQLSSTGAAAAAAFARGLQSGFAGGAKSGKRQDSLLPAEGGLALSPREGARGRGRGRSAALDAGSGSGSEEEEEEEEEEEGMGRGFIRGALGSRAAGAAAGGAASLAGPASRRSSASFLGGLLQSSSRGPSRAGSVLLGSSIGSMRGGRFLGSTLGLGGLGLSAGGGGAGGGSVLLDVGSLAALPWQQQEALRGTPLTPEEKQQLLERAVETQFHRCRPALYHRGLQWCSRGATTTSYSSTGSSNSGSGGAFLGAGSSLLANARALAAAGAALPAQTVLRMWQVPGQQEGLARVSRSSCGLVTLNCHSRQMLAAAAGVRVSGAAGAAAAPAVDSASQGRSFLMLCPAASTATPTAASSFPPPESPAAAAAEAAGRTAAAVWLPQPLDCTRGFSTRMQLALHCPLALSAEEGKLPQTASFALALHSSQQLLRLGENYMPSPAEQRKAVQKPAAVVPPAGYTGLEDAVIIHVLCKPLEAPTALPAAASGPSSSPSSQQLPKQRYRLVAAVYGPVGAGGGTSHTQVASGPAAGRPLLGSGAVMDASLPCLGLYSSSYSSSSSSGSADSARVLSDAFTKAAGGAAAAADTAVFALNLSLDLLAEGSSTDASPGTGSSTSSSKLCLHFLDESSAVKKAAAGGASSSSSSPYLQAGSRAPGSSVLDGNMTGARAAKQLLAAAGGGGGGAAGSSASALPLALTPALLQQETVQVVQAELPLSQYLGLHMWRGPGRGRAWLGLTGEAFDLQAQQRAAGGSGGAAGSSSSTSSSSFSSSSSSNLVSLECLDCITLSDRDADYSSLHVRYSRPWPLHILLTGPSLALYEELFRMLAAAKRVSLQLQECWKRLMEAFSQGGRGATAAAAAAARDRGRKGGAASGTRRGGAAGALGDAADQDGGEEGRSSSRGRSGSRGPTGAAAAAGRRSRSSSAAAPRGSSSSSSSSSSSGSAPLADTLSAAAADAAAEDKASARQALSQQLKLQMGLHRMLQPVWLLRSTMATVVDAFLYHLQVDVIEEHFSQLEGKLEEEETRAAAAAAAGAFEKDLYEALQAAAAGEEEGGEAAGGQTSSSSSSSKSGSVNFSFLCKCHEELLLGLMSGSFLQQPALSDCLQRIFRHCSRFCRMLLAAAQGGAAASGAAAAAGSRGSGPSTSLPSPSLASDSSATALLDLLRPDKQRAEFMEVRASFFTDVRILVGLLHSNSSSSSSSSMGRGNAAGSLLTRLNFSGFYGDF